MEDILFCHTCIIHAIVLVLKWYTYLKISHLHRIPYLLCFSTKRMTAMRALILVGVNFYPTDEDLADLGKHFPDVEFVVRKRGGYEASDIDTFDIIMGHPDPKDLIKATSLKWLQTPTAGVNLYAHKQLYAHADVLVSSASGTYGRQIGDHVLGFIVAHNHGFFNHYEQMKQRKWERYFPEKDLFSLNLVIIGFGDLGSQIARKAKALDMRVLVVRRRADGAEHPSVDAFYQLDAIDEALRQADYVAIAAAGTDDTLHMINSEKLKVMKEGCVLINVARGTLVDENALVDALKEGQIGGAYLDVTEKEPLGEESPLWGMKNVFITSHSSGLSYTTTPLVLEIFIENLSAFLEGRNLRNQVDFDRGY